MAARATGQAHTAQVTERSGRSGRVPQVVTRSTAASAVAAGSSSESSVWARRANIGGRIGIWAIPVLAVLAAFSLKSTDAFSTNSVVYAHFLATKWSSPMAIALTTATVVFTLISLVGLTLVLLGSRAKRLAIAGLVPGVAGALMMALGVGSVVVQAQGAATPVWHEELQDFVVTAQARGTHAAWLVFGGAALLTIGWILLGLAVMRTHGLNRGDGALLAISAPLVYLGGFVLHILPALGAFLLVAAGLGIIFTAGRVADAGLAARAAGPLRAPRVPATMPSAFARFTDDDLDSYAASVAPADESPAELPADVPVAASAGPATVAGLPRTHSNGSHGAHTGSTHPHSTATSAAPAHGGTGDNGAADAGRRRGLGRLSRGISTAWLVNRAKPASPSAATGAAAADGAAKAKSNGSLNGSAKAASNGAGRDRMKGLVNPPAKSRWSGFGNHSSTSPQPNSTANGSTPAINGSAAAINGSGLGTSDSKKSKGSKRSGSTGTSSTGTSSTGTGSTGTSSTGKASSGMNRADNGRKQSKSKPVNGSPGDDRGTSKGRRGGKSGTGASEGGRGSTSARE